MLTQTVNIGEFTIGGFVEREFRLDGGTMFGVIPRVMWQKLVEPDDKNMVAMRTNLFVVTTPDGQKILLDAGLGDALSDFDRKMYSVDGDSNMAPGLAELGVSPEEVDFVILTHLHTDHANGIYTGDPNNPSLRFPNAQHVIQRDEWDDATHPNERTAAVYYPSRLVVLEQSGRIQLVAGSAEIVPGVSVEQTGGHTRGHQGVTVQSRGETFIYYADIFPSRFHVRAPFVPSVDTYPLETLQFKKRLLAFCQQSNAVIGFDHETEFLMGRLIEGQKWLDVSPI